MLCPACASSSSRCTDVQFGNRNQLPWYHCLDCGSFFDAGGFDKDSEIAHLQNTDYGSNDLGIDVCQFKTPMYDAIVKLLKNASPPPGSLLDIGCSYGGFLVRAQAEGYKVYGSDINPRAVDYVQALGIPAALACSIEEVDLVEDCSLDVVSCLDCNCYWTNQPGELRFAFDKLKPGGYLVMRVVDKSWMCRLALKIRRLAPTLAGYVLQESVNDHRFSMPVRSLLKIIQSCGFEVINASPRGAVHSNKSRWITRASFALGSIVWGTTGIFLAPGALVLAKKPFKIRSKGF